MPSEYSAQLTRPGLIASFPIDSLENLVRSVSFFSPCPYESSTIFCHQMSRHVTEVDDKA